MEDTTTYLYCSCGAPFAKIENGVIVIQSRHHGDTHINYIPLAANQVIDRERKAQEWLAEKISELEHEFAERRLALQKQAIDLMKSESP
jgi:hypothetical protein